MKKFVPSSILKTKTPHICTMSTMDFMSDFCKPDIYGYRPEILIEDPAEVKARLDAILGDKLLRFNPYLVDDDALLACAERGQWRPWPSLTQMVVFHFHDIRKLEWKHSYEAIFFHIGNDSREMHLSMNSLTKKVTYDATMQQIHVLINDRPLTNAKMVERMVGKDYFVSHALPARTEAGQSRAAYRMYRLRGDEREQAALIREKMIESKIAMLREILAHPYAEQYLRCSRNFIEYTTPIEAAITAIRHFHHINKGGDLVR